MLHYSRDPITIKQVSTGRFDLTLLATFKNTYVVQVTEPDGFVDSYQEVLDVKTAFYLFDMKQQDLEGH